MERTSPTLVTSRVLALALCVCGSNADAAPTPRAVPREARRHTIAARTASIARRLATADSATGGSIIGTIYGADLGTPVYGARIEIAYTETSTPERPVRPAWSDTAGAYAITGLDAGTVTM